VYLIREQRVGIGLEEPAKLGRAILNVPPAKTIFWIVLGILVVGFVSISMTMLKRVSSPSVITQVGVLRPPNWHAFVNQELGFSILFPGQPKERNETTSTRAGRMSVRQYGCSELDRVHAYGISVAALPFTNKFSDEQIQIMLDAGRDEALGADGKLLTEQKITLGSNPGREFDMEKMDGKAFVKVRVWFVDNRIYTLTSVGPSGERVLTNASMFLDSFKLIDLSTKN
jgi:hypothetical protein